MNGHAFFCPKGPKILIAISSLRRSAPFLSLSHLPVNIETYQHHSPTVRQQQPSQMHIQRPFHVRNSFFRYQMRVSSHHDFRLVYDAEYRADPERRRGTT